MEANCSLRSSRGVILVMGFRSFQGVRMIGGR
jgi:hypothetical protein